MIEYREEPPIHPGPGQQRLGGNHREALSDDIDGNQRDAKADAMQRPDVAAARRNSMKTPLEVVVAEQPAIVLCVVVRDVQIVVSDQALRDHQVMRLVAARGVLAVRGEGPRDEKHGETDFPPPHATRSFTGARHDVPRTSGVWLRVWPRSSAHDRHRQRQTRARRLSTDATSA